MVTNDLAQVLNDCQASAEKGYEIASSQEKVLTKVLSNARDTIDDTRMAFADSACYSPETSDLLDSQLTQVEQALMGLSFAFQNQ